MNEKSKPMRVTLPVIAGAVCLALLVITAYVVLVGENLHYLRKVDELSYFAFTGEYFVNCFKLPAALLWWLSVLLTQFFYYPWLGATLFTALLMAMAMLTRQAFDLKGSWTPLAMVPAVMMLWAAVNPGYVIYVIKTPGYIYSGALGFCAALLLFVGFRHYSGLWAQILWLLLTASVGYVLVGAYALGALVMMMASLAVTRGRGWWIAMICAAVAGVCLPWLMSRHLYFGLMQSSIYSWGLPRLAMLDTVLWWPYAIGGAFMLLASCGVMRQGHGWPRLRLSVSVAGFAGAMALLLVYRYNDVNFSRAMEMANAVEAGDWSGAVAAGKKGFGKPTRLVCLLTHLSLNKLERAGDKLFTIQQAGEPYNARGPVTGMREVGARTINYHFGRINDCYRWCMEDMVEYGPRVEYLKYMTKCALLNGELKLAQRYNSMLAATWFHRSWARKYQEFIDNPSTMDTDPEFQSVRPMMAYTNHIGGDNGLVEGYVLSVLAAMSGGNPQLVEYSIQANLIRKNIGNFWPRIMLYASDHPRLPRHYQEAIILFSVLENKVDFRQFNLDPDIVKRFDNFFSMAQKYGSQPVEVNYDRFFPLFGDTYWFYYFFSHDLKTT